MTADHPRSSLAVWLIAAGILFVVYALSVGPAVCLSDHGYISEEALVIYKPLDFVAWICPPAKAFFRWYHVRWQRLWPPF
jgi:hypothetical protein